MPTYEYECPEGHTFETFQRINDEPVAKCPTCGAQARRKISGGAGFLFKGAGFYITDYRSDDYKKKATAESGGAKEKAEGKSEPKAEGASGTKGDPKGGGSKGSKAEP